MALADGPCLMCGQTSIRRHFIHPWNGKFGYYTCQLAAPVATPVTAPVSGAAPSSARTTA